MLVKNLVFAALASLAAAAPGGQWDGNDANWGKDQCTVKYTTQYTTATNYVTDVDYVYSTTVKSTLTPYVTEVPVTTWVAKTLTSTKYSTTVNKYPVTKVVTVPTTKSTVKSEEVCKTQWYGDHWDYGSDSW